MNKLNVGFGSILAAERIIAIAPPGNATMNRLKNKAKEQDRLIDLTFGRKTRSIIIMDNNHIILSAIQFETVSNRYGKIEN